MRVLHHTSTQNARSRLEPQSFIKSSAMVSIKRHHAPHRHKYRTTYLHDVTHKGCGARLQLLVCMHAGAGGRQGSSAAAAALAAYCLQWLLEMPSPPLDNRTVATSTQLSLLLPLSILDTGPWGGPGSR